MFKKLRRPSTPPEKPDDEREIEDDARAAITESREQISRAKDILQGEVRRLDALIKRGR